MSLSKYKRLEEHPRTKAWEETGVARLTETEAETLNECTKHTGVKYEIEKKKTTAKK